MKKTLLIVGLLLVGMFIPPEENAYAKESKWVLGVGREGSFAYVAGVGFSRIINKYAPDVHVDISSRKGYNTCYKIIAKGKRKLDMTASETMSLLQLYKGKGEFSKVPENGRIYQGIFGWPFQAFFVAAKNSDINGFDDLAGKKVCPGPAGTAVRPLGKFILDDVTGVWNKIKEVQFGSMMDYADGLKSGAIDAVIGYTAGSGVPGVVKNYDAKCKIKVIPFTEKHTARLLKSPGWIPISTPAKQIFSQDVGMDVVKSAAVIGGFSFARYVPVDTAYRIVKAVWEHPEEFVQLVPQASTFLNQREELNRLGMDALSINPIIPIHPGAAKYYKEIGLWKNNWVEGKVIPLK